MKVGATSGHHARVSLVRTQTEGSAPLDLVFFKYDRQDSNRVNKPRLRLLHVVPERRALTRTPCLVFDRVELSGRRGAPHLRIATVLSKQPQWEEFDESNNDVVGGHWQEPFRLPS